MPIEKRLITAEDLYNLNKLSQPQISPDGRYIFRGGEARPVSEMNKPPYSRLMAPKLSSPQTGALTPI